MVEPSESQGLGIELGYRIDRVSAQLPGLARCADAEMIVRSDHQIMFGVRTKAVMLPKIMNCRDLAVVVITGDRQDGDIDRGELFAVGCHRLPVSVEGGVLQPALKERVGRAINGVEIAIGSSAGKPLLIEQFPACWIIVGFEVKRSVVCDEEWPAVIGIE